MKKIMFNDNYGLTDAVLKGRKTMTRRIIPIDIFNATDWKAFKEGDMMCYGTFEGDWVDIRRVATYQVGEVVAVAQNYQDVYEELKRTHGSSSIVTRDFFHKYVQGGRMPVSNKMFVRADLMPHRIRITGIKVEKLQDISGEDCLREGIAEKEGFWNTYSFDGSNKPKKLDRSGSIVLRELFLTPRNAFAALIDKVSGKGTWDKNPYVFAYSFEKID